LVLASPAGIKRGREENFIADLDVQSRPQIEGIVDKIRKAQAVKFVKKDCSRAPNVTRGAAR
jgi:hypothetical protein